MEELIKLLYESKFITKDDLEQFGKTCQLLILTTIVENSSNIEEKIKEKIYLLKQELIIDDNKLSIIMNNRSLN
ncbi:MAG TPA: hypothetical protein PKD00_01940 [Burkholderiales bacterium]|nr:hypothetical protein [Burkholderiales bacterium]